MRMGRSGRWRMAMHLLGAALVLACVQCQWVIGINVERGGDGQSGSDAGETDAHTAPISLPDAEADAGPLAKTCVLGVDDPRNCGACGHDCGASKCSGGMCEREVVAELVSLHGSSCLMRDANRVYVADGTTIFSMNVSGSPDVVTLGTAFPDGNECAEILVHRGKVILARWSDVVRMDLDGKNATKLWSTTNPAESVTDLELVGDILYIATRSGLRRLDLASDAGAVTLETSANGARALATNAGALFFGTIINAPELRQKSLDGGASTLHTSTPTYVFSSASQEDEVLFLSGTSLYQVRPATGSLLEPLSGSLGTGRGRDLELKDGLAYASISGITDELDGTIVRVDPRTQQQLVLARGGFNYMDIAVDDTHVYFGDFEPTTSRARLVRVPR